jgi:hypothetical protein
MPTLPPEALLLAPLGVAAGVDLYLTLLLLGAAPTLRLWDTPLPGALGDLDSPSVLITVGLFYVLEFAAERFTPSAVVWNAFHALIRPVSGALLALLLLDGHPAWIVAAGASVTGVITSLSHGIRSGGAVLRWLGAGVIPSARLLSTAEDVTVLGLVSLSLDAPVWSFVAATLTLTASAPYARSLLRAFAYAVRLVGGRFFVTFGQRRWRNPDELPTWVTSALEDNDALAPGGALRGSPAAAWRLPGAPTFAIGWVVVRGGAPVFLYRRGRAAAVVDPGTVASVRVTEHDLFQRVDLEAPSLRAFLLFERGGPSVESLRAEFAFSASR